MATMKLQLQKLQMVMQPQQTQGAPATPAVQKNQPSSIPAAPVVIYNTAPFANTQGRRGQGGFGRGRGNNVGKRYDQCHACGKMGHWARKCRTVLQGQAYGYNQQGNPQQMYGQPMGETHGKNSIPFPRRCTRFKGTNNNILGSSPHRSRKRK
uniref:CCHC-type domain-containing protein n=1 Tax=Neogobius melanostomus TaxID=47308 RepID=A0A8C6T783_9GOBI